MPRARTRTWSNYLLSSEFRAEQLTPEEQREIGRTMIAARRRAEAAETPYERDEAMAEHYRERDRLVLLVVPWVVREANRRYGRTGCSIDDVIADGMLRVIQALAEYDPEKGAATTFLTTSASRQMSNYVRRRHPTIRASKQDQAIEIAVLKGKRDESDLSPKEAKQLKRARLARSIVSGDEQRLGRDGNLTLFDSIEAPTREESPYDAEDLAKLSEAFATLAPRPRKVLSWRFALADGTRPETLREVGKRIGKSPEGTRYIQRTAFATLREKMTASH